MKFKRSCCIAVGFLNLLHTPVILININSFTDRSMVMWGTDIWGEIWEMVIKNTAIFLLLTMVFCLCNPCDRCTHSLFQDCCIVKLIISNRPTYLHTGTTLWRGIVSHALVGKTIHVVISGKRVRTRRHSDRYCTRVWMSGMFWCDQ